MEIRQLTALVTVAEVGSVTRAAELLHHVQPAVSRQIRLLEEELGVRLFERTSRGMVLTGHGRQLVTRARRALNELDRARIEIESDSSEISGTVAVGVLDSVADITIKSLVANARKRFPKVHLRVLTGFSKHLQQWLDNGELDLALLYNVETSPMHEVVPLLEESLWAIAPTSFKLDPTLPVDWETVTGQPLILPVAGHGLRSLLDLARPDIEWSTLITVETNSMRVQKELVHAGEGWTLIFSAGVAQDVMDGIFSGAPVDPVISRRIILALPRQQHQSPEVWAIARELRRLVQDSVATKLWSWARPLGRMRDS